MDGLACAGSAVELRPSRLASAARDDLPHGQGRLPGEHSELLAGSFGSVAVGRDGALNSRSLAHASFTGGGSVVA
jgi:hypothetical protein